MNAAWYEKQGPARQVLVVGTLPDPEPEPGEVRIRVAASGVNPGDVKKRQDAFGYGMPYPRVIPHSDGAGTIDAVGEGVSQEWIGGGKCGVTERKLIGLLALPLNTLLCLWRRRFHYPQVF